MLALSAQKIYLSVEWRRDYVHHDPVFNIGSRVSFYIYLFCLFYNGLYGNIPERQQQIPMQVLYPSLNSSSITL